MLDNQKYMDLMSRVQGEQINTQFRSTRDSGLTKDFWESVLVGKDEKGGLLMPTGFPEFSEEFLRKLEILTVPQISAYLTRHFVPREEIGDEELYNMMKIAHNFDLPLGFMDRNAFVLRLDQGPTASFKDVAARELRQMMEAHCKKFGKKLNLVVATSGDTGVAIMNAFGDSKDITVTVMYPTDGVSPPQEKQMLDTKNKFKNTQVVPIEGNFDNCQDISILLQAAKNLDKKEGAKLNSAIQDIIAQAKLKLTQTLTGSEVQELREILKGVPLGSANSQNIWRLIPQMTQYLVGIGKGKKGVYLEEGEKVVYAVPSGNVGHLTAGILAMESGAPIKKFIVGTNANNILAGLINRGEIQHPGFQNTGAPSMDIGDPNNFERILDYAATKIGFEGNIDYKKMKNAITKLDKKISDLRKQIEKMEEKNVYVEVVDIQRAELAKALKKTIKLQKYGVTTEMIKYLQSFIHVEDVVTNDEMYAGMCHTAQEIGVVMETHGITAKIATDRARAKGFIGEKDKVIILETAHPDKFPDALEKAGIPDDQEEILAEYGIRLNRHPELERLKELKIKNLDKPEPVAKNNILAVAKNVRALAEEMGCLDEN